MCGCNKTVTSTATLMAGSTDAQVMGEPRFKVVSKTETATDPETGVTAPVVLSTHYDYKSASIAREATGGRIRLIS